MCLYYYGARYYDPKLARFISPDNYGDDYVYCNNNPVMYVDPTGNIAVPIAVAGAMAVGGAMIAAAAVSYAIITAGGYLSSSADPEVIKGGQDVCKRIAEVGSIPFVAVGETRAGAWVLGKVAQHVPSIAKSIKTMENLNEGTAWYTATQSIGLRGTGSPRDYYNAGVDYGSFLGFGGAASRSIRWGGKLAGDYLGKYKIFGTTLSNITWGNLYGPFIPAANYLKKGTAAGSADAFWGTRPWWAQVNTGIGISEAWITRKVKGSISPTTQAQFDKAASHLRGIGAFGQKAAEDAGVDLNRYTILGNSMQGFFDRLRDAGESAWDKFKDKLGF